MAWFERLPRAVQGWLALVGVLMGLLGGAFALGARSSVLIVEQRGLPGRVTSVERRVDTLTSTTTYLMHIDSIRPAVWGNVSEMAADVRETRCFVRAMALKEDPLTRCSSMLNEPVR